MPALRLSDKPKHVSLPQIESRIPKPEELVVLSKPLLIATIMVGKALMDCTNKWAIGGDVAEVISGVNVHPDHIAILTTREGCDEITRNLAGYQIEPPLNVEREIERDAKVDLKLRKVRIKSYTARFDIHGSRLDVHGDLQIKVGDWDWGDPLDFEPDYIYVVGVKVPIVPLKMKSEIYTGLGWMDRASKIHEAVKRSRHMFG
ncbi:hypothetical protein E6H33_08125 [Candidatus Bathyarchaeota archaeon]|nr:MAG: hypothetical protein E6H33_08125 [Candidatus Bathyarchaeota archaeon]TMI22975.1 MAG: hypothetical protein E6H31_00405 [Candidatus Bathyarchaeota archaeon]